MKRFSRRSLSIGVLFLLSSWMPSSHAEDKPLQAMATFSILGDMVKSVGGDRVEVTTLVGPDSDAHAYSPTPADAKNILKADIVFVNGWGFEGWLDRLVDASGYKGTLITATDGIEGLPFDHEDEHDDHHDDHGDKHDDNKHGDKHDDDHKHEDKHDDDHKHEDKHDDHDEEKHADAHGHHHGDTDPHAWQSLTHAKTYIQNITKALKAADPEGSQTYEANRDAYLKELEALEKLAAETLAKLPKNRRTVVTSHDAFSYFADAYGLRFLAPQGLNPEAEASAKDVAALIEQIRDENITALFLENIVSPRLLEQIAAESGATIGGTLYADGLSQPDGDAGTYLKMMKHNITTVYETLAKNSKGQDDHDHDHDREMEQHSSHEHGVARLTIAATDTGLEITMESPAANLFGFEHKAGNDEEHHTVYEAEEKLEAGGTLFIANEAAGCTLDKTAVESVVIAHHKAQKHGDEEHDHDKHEEDEHDKHGHEKDEHDKHKKDEHDKHDHQSEGSHSDVEATWTFTCKQPAEISEVAVKLFSAFPNGFEHLNVEWISAKGAGAIELEADGIVKLSQ